MDYEKEVFCPLIHKYITKFDCFETETVTERLCIVYAPVDLMEIKIGTGNSTSAWGKSYRKKLPGSYGLGSLM